MAVDSEMPAVGWFFRFLGVWLKCQERSEIYRSHRAPLQRAVPNGNTFVDEGMNGRFFQITPAGEIVWEYISPYFGRDTLGSAGKTFSTNYVYRAQAVPYD